MSVKSNILKTRLKSESAQFVNVTPIPPEEWPTIINTPVFSEVTATVQNEPDPDPDITLIGAGASWTQPTSTVTFVLLMAAAQDNAVPLPSIDQYEIIKQVDGVDGSFEDLGLDSVYTGFFGDFTLSDVGRFVPYIMKFVDLYDREEIVINAAAEILEG